MCKPSQSAGAVACYLELEDLNYKREVEGIEDKWSSPRGCVIGTPLQSVR
jgi:hypothetical protein